MEKSIDRKALRRRVRHRVRRKVSGSGARPRLAVFRSDKHIYVQAVDDDAGTTLAAASSLDTAIRAEKSNKTETAKRVGGLIADRLREKGIDQAVFDRGGCVYHGRVRALADAARAGGLKF